MARIPLTEDIAGALAQFFRKSNAPTPSHKQLGEIFRRAGVQDLDPRTDETDKETGKEVRIRVVFGEAARRADRDTVLLVGGLLAQMRVAGCFDPTSASFGGSDAVQSAQRAFKASGWILESDGHLSPLVLMDIDAAQSRPAIEMTLNRIQRSTFEGPVLLTDAKSLLEATAKHVLDALGCNVTQSMDFDQMLFLARERLQLLPQQVTGASEEERFEREIYDGMWKIARATNKIRNTPESNAHGHRTTPSFPPETSRLIVQSAAQLSQLMLHRLDRLLGHPSAVAS